MAVVRKTAVLQVRCKPEDLEAFQVACEASGLKPTEAIRRFMVEEALRLKRREASNAAWRASSAAMAKVGTEVSASAKKPPVEAIRKPQSLSERRAAEKAAKEARKARKAENY
jgi:antitoxin component of RelBE/YafQ-DinJ toxin-antitoxin module